MEKEIQNYNVLNKICRGSISLYQMIKNHYKLQYISDFEKEFLTFLQDTLISFPIEEKKIEINSISIEYTTESQMQILKRVIINEFSKLAPNQNPNSLNVVCYGYKRPKNINKGEKKKKFE
jgi:hypothetical protein